MAFLGWFVNQCNCSAIDNSLCLVLFTIYFVGNSITIDCKTTFNYNIVRWHCGRCLTPTAEGMAFLGWFVNQCNCSAIDNSLGFVFFTIDFVGNSITIDCKATFNYNIVRWHCLGRLTPSAEGVTLLDRSVTKNYFATVCNAIEKTGHSIDFIGQPV